VCVCVCALWIHFSNHTTESVTQLKGMRVAKKIKFHPSRR